MRRAIIGTQLRKDQRCKSGQHHWHIDAQTDSFSNDMDKAIEEEQKVLADCSVMTYVNSAGLRVFLLSLKRVTKNDSKYFVCILNENIGEIFNIFGFNSLFKIYDFKDEDLKNF